MDSQVTTDQGEHYEGVFEFTGAKIISCMGDSLITEIDWEGDPCNRIKY